MDTANRKAENKRQLSGMLGFIERAGNKIPHPIYMFIAFFFLTLVLSAICAAAGVKAVNPVNDKEVAAVNLLTAGGIADILKSFPSVWASFAPIGAVFIATLGLGVANGSGFLKGILSLASNFKSKFIVTMIVVLIGINGNLIGDTAFVVFPPLIAILYINLKRNPLAGLFTAYASVACGFGAALVVGNGDAMLAGMTEAAARLVDPAMVVSPASGYYFMLVSTILLSPAIAWVSIKFVEKKLDDTGMGVEFELKEEEHIKVSLSDVENKAMKSAALGLAGLVLVLVAMGFKGEPGANVGKIVKFLKTLSDVKIVEANYKEHPQPDDFVTEEDTKNLKYSPAMVGNYKRYFEAVSLYSSENKADTDKWVTDAKDSFFVKWLTGHLKDGHPIIAHTNLWNGHYVVIVGYDNGGTPQLGDDVLIIADPYDTWDHWQDGFIVLPLEKFFYEWNDFNIAAKPYQLQPFVVVGKK